MSHFKYAAGSLHCEELGLADVGDEYGTPAYVYSREALVEAFQKLDRVFSDLPHLICYALKANGNLSVGRVFAKMGAGADIVSGGELYRALQMGVPADRIVFAGVGKTVAEIEYALKTGIMMLNAESIGELEVIDRVASRLGVKAPVALRVNPEVDPRTHPYISTGMKKYKFGIPCDQAVDIYARWRDLQNIEFVGIQCHIGSQLISAGPIIESVRKLVDLAARVQGLGVHLRYLDIGGGLGITYCEEQPDGPEVLAGSIIPLVRSAGLKLVLEPGRYLVGNAGVLLTRVLYVKNNGVKTFVIVDAGMNDLIRPSLYDAYHRILPVKEPDEPAEIVDVVGPVCESGDFFAHERELPPTRPGDLLAIMSAGAYGFTMSSNYNARPRAVEILVQGNSACLARRRESYEDLVRGE